MLYARGAPLPPKPVRLCTIHCGSAYVAKPSESRGGRHPCAGMCVERYVSLRKAPDGLQLAPGFDCMKRGEYGTDCCLRF